MILSLCRNQNFIVMYILIYRTPLKSDGSDYCNKLARDFDRAFESFISFFKSLSYLHGFDVVKVEMNTKDSAIIKFGSCYVTSNLYDNYVEFFFKSLHTLLPSSVTSAITPNPYKKGRRSFSYSLFTICLCN